MRSRLAVNILIELVLSCSWRFFFFFKSFTNMLINKWKSRSKTWSLANRSMSTKICLDGGDIYNIILGDLWVMWCLTIKRRVSIFDQIYYCSYYDSGFINMLSITKLPPVFVSLDLMVFGRWFYHRPSPPCRCSV